MSDAQATSSLATGRGRLLLALVCAVGFLDFVDASIVNVALPSIRAALHISVQNLQWVLSGYLLTYGGFLLLGGRAADLLGRRRVLIAGTMVFGLASLTAGLANHAGELIGARFVQGVGAAMMLPAALSILTTTYQEDERRKALGVWGAIAGIASALGVVMGGVLSQGPGWRWVFFVNPPFCALILVGALFLVPRDPVSRRQGTFDLSGAVLGTAGLLLLIYSLVKAPDIGWATGRTIGGLVIAAALLIGFVGNEHRHANPLMPLSIFRIKGLAAADATQLIAIAALYAVFYFITLYMQDVLGYSQIKAGVAYIPITIAVAVAAGIATVAFPRVGTRTVVVAGALIAAGAVFYLSQIPLHGHYANNLLPGLIFMGLGLGAVFVGVQTAANAGVPADQAGLAASLVSTAQQVGPALGLAVFSALATARTNHLLGQHTAGGAALTSGFHRALLAASIFLLVAALIATRTASVTEPVDPLAIPVGST